MMDEIEQLLSERAGLNLEVLGSHALKRAVATRMSACAVSDTAAYARLLHASPRELDQLVDELAVLETWFFRDSGAFDFLQAHAKGCPGLRILSAGCATGEEPYSIAMALLDAGLLAGSFCVDACDLSQRAIEVASRAVYGLSSFRESWHNFRDRWFTPVADGFALRPEVARLVTFHREDLLHPVYLVTQHPYHLVFCRNLLIYLRPQAQDLLIGLLGRLLRSDGIVVTGHAETGILLRHGYQPVGQPECFACRKHTTAAVTELPPIMARRETVPIARPAVAAPPIKLEPVPDRSELLKKARQLADQGSFDAAWSLCETLLDQGSDADVYYLEGIIRAAQNRLDGARECFRKALYLDPAHYESLIQMSLLCERQGDPVQAVRFRDRAARLATCRPEMIDAQRI
jgi:chemotaxis protein methyltransferase WspC